MTGTVTKLMGMVDLLCCACTDDVIAAEQAIQNYESCADKLRQALQDELTRLFTPLTDEPVHQHKWFKTGAMEPGEWRCIDCGKWGKENGRGITGESK